MLLRTGLNASVINTHNRILSPRNLAHAYTQLPACCATGRL